MSTPTLHINLFAILASLFISTRCDHQSRKDAALFIFGDSVNDAGTNNYINTTAGFRANFPPYGETFFRYPTGKFSNGLLIVDFIAEYANLPLIPAYLQMKDGEFMGGANFASAGACALVDTYKGYLVDLKMQQKQLEQLEKKLRKEMGSEKAKSIIKEGNIQVGGRKFAMIGLGPIGCVPAMRALTRNGTCSGKANKLAKLHNIALPSIPTKLESQLQGFECSYFYIYTIGSDSVQNPSKYGLKEEKTACCGLGPYRAEPTCGSKRGVEEYSLCRHPEKHVFFDANHPSERANRQVAQLMWNGSLSVIKPHNLEALFKLEGV